MSKTLWCHGVERLKCGSLKMVSIWGPVDFARWLAVDPVNRWECAE